MSHFPKQNTSGPRPDVRTRDLCVVSLSPSHLSYRGLRLTRQHLKCLCVNTCLIFNPWWIFSPCNMIMCTNKTCFAGVGTWPKPIFRIIISFLSNPCESKKKSEFSVIRSDFDSWCKPGVSCSWMEFDFCFAIKNSGCLKRLSVVQILRVTVHWEMRTYTFNCFLLALWRSRSEEDLFGSWKIDADKSCDQLLKIVLRYRGHLHEESYKRIFRYSKEPKSFTIDIVSKSAQNTHLTAEPMLKQRAWFPTSDRLETWLILSGTLRSKQ